MSGNPEGVKNASRGECLPSYGVLVTVMWRSGTGERPLEDGALYCVSV